MLVGTNQQGAARERVTPSLPINSKAKPTCMLKIPLLFFYFFNEPSVSTPISSVYAKLESSMARSTKEKSQRFYTEADVL